MEISKVRQALDWFYEMADEDVLFNDEMFEEKRNNFKTLDQFITDYENLVKENEELKEVAYKVGKHFIIAGKKDNLSTQEIINILKDADLEIQQEKDYLQKENEKLKKKSKSVNNKNPNPTPNRETPPPRTSLHDNQAIEPSVLEKYDVLIKENNELKERLKKYE